ncbi:MAG: TetR/AcrR family transcriptional regulator [Streptosporangiaceae bacterium]
MRASSQAAAPPQARALRRDARRNAERILDSAREVFGESGADACIEEIAARAGVGVGTVYRRFASKGALMDELLRVALEDLIAAADQALARDDGHGLEYLLRAFGQSFADHAGYANLLLGRQHDPADARRLRDAIAELTARAVAGGTVGPGAELGDVMALISAMRGLVHGPDAENTDVWARFPDIHLAGLRRTSG